MRHPKAISGAAYDLAVATDNPVTELAARAYLRYLQTERPDVLWVRLPDREVERLWSSVTGHSGPGDEDLGVGLPDDVYAAA